MYFLNINKPKGITSFDVIRYLRKELKIKQIGHSGTLDPLALGVMQVAVGNATKLLDYLDGDKEYIANIVFGFNSTTFDEEGEKTFVCEPNFSRSELENVLATFIGKTFQIPPKYSAIKINGQKMCDLARKNIDFEIKPREIEIYSIELLQFSKNSAKIKVFCKKGTYIRSLINDIGEKLSCGAYMSDLIRTKAGNFLIENSNELGSEYIKISPLEALNLPQKELNEQEYQKVINGNTILSSSFYDDNYLLLTKDNKLVSIANLSDNQIKPKKVFKEE